MSDLEEVLYYQIRSAGLPMPDREARLIPGRRHRVDLYWPHAKLVVEVEGGTWVNGAHSRGKHFEGDCWKYNELALMGYTVLRFTTDMISRGEALAMIERALIGKQTQIVIVSGNKTEAA